MVVYKHMTKVREKIQARLLRREGRSLVEIASRLSISKSAASLWCRDVSLSPRARRRLDKRREDARYRAALKGARANHKKKQAHIASHLARALGEIETLTPRELLITGVALYWGEGSKKSSFSFINSDPAMIRIFLRWLSESMGVSAEDVIARVFINESQRSRHRAIESYWARELRIPRSRFRATTFIRHVHHKSYSNAHQYVGLVAIRVRRSTDLKYRVLGLIEALKCSTFEKLSG